MNAMGRPSKIETDVLIVGAGPVGLMMACELLRRGINCRIIDKSDTTSQTSKALGIQSRTLEVFENMGIVEEFLARGLKVVGANVREGETLLFRPDTRYLKAPYPYILSLPQSDTELLLPGYCTSLAARSSGRGNWGTSGKRETASSPSSVESARASQRRSSPGGSLGATALTAGFVILWGFPSRGAPTKKSSC